MFTSKYFSFLLILAAALLILCTFAGATSASMKVRSSLSGQAAPGEGARRITPAEVRDALEKGSAVLVDVRGEDSYKAGHVKGALLIPWNELLGRLNELPHDKLIITYCS